MGALPVFGKATSPLTFLTHFPRKVSVCVPGNGFSEGNDPKMSPWSLLNPGSAGGLDTQRIKAKSDADNDSAQTGSSYQSLPPRITERPKQS